MRSSITFAAGVAALLGAMMQPAHAQSAVYLATYVEVMPAAVQDGAGLLQRYREAGRKETGNERFAVLQESGRPNRFVILETWSDQGALDAHRNAAPTAQFRDAIKAIQGSPNDERVNNGLYVGAVDAARVTDAVYVVTHVDVVPPRKDDCVALLKDMAEETRKDGGNLSYEVLQQPNRLNHFTVAEIWKDRSALDAHQMAAHTRQFREKLAPMAGALYDERFYKSMD